LGGLVDGALVALERLGWLSWQKAVAVQADKDRLPEYVALVVALASLGLCRQTVYYSFSLSFFLGGIDRVG
jgi:hypothetical protein